MEQKMSQHEKIRKITFGAILIAISLVLGMTGWGFIPLPLPIAGATIFHIPVILAGILVGPEIGFITGLVFGIFAFTKYSSLFPWFALIPARPFIGVTSYYVFELFYKLLNRQKGKSPFHLTLPAALGGITGSLTNSIGTLGLGYFFKVFGKTIEVNRAAIISSIPVAILEAILAAILLPILVIPLYAYIHPNQKNDSAD
ncbi:ECF transporter S component [bacterium]|nr:ECF transporter S component [bacterium]